MTQLLVQIAASARVLWTPRRVLEEAMVSCVWAPPLLLLCFVILLFGAVDLFVPMFSGLSMPGFSGTSEFVQPIVSDGIVIVAVCAGYVTWALFQALSAQIACKLAGQKIGYPALLTVASYSVLPNMLRVVMAELLFRAHAIGAAWSSFPRLPAITTAFGCGMLLQKMGVPVAHLQFLNTVSVFDLWSIALMSVGIASLKKVSPATSAFVSVAPFCMKVLFAIFV